MTSTNNTTSNRDIPSYFNVFHSVLFEQMADLEALRATSDNPTDSDINKETLFKTYQTIFPSYVSLGDTGSYFRNSSWNDTDNIPNYLEYNYDDAFAKSPPIGDLFEDAGSSNISSKSAETPCHLITSEEAESYENIAFKLELIVQPIFVIIGFSFNTIAINILRR